MVQGSFLRDSASNPVNSQQAQHPCKQEKDRAEIVLGCDLPEIYFGRDAPCKRGPSKLTERTFGLPASASPAPPPTPRLLTISLIRATGVNVPAPAFSRRITLRRIRLELWGIAT